MLSNMRRDSKSWLPVHSRFIFLTLVTALLTACAGAPSRDTAYGSGEAPRSTARSERAGPGQGARPALPGAGNLTALGSSVAELAMDLIGAPYRYGGADPDGFDCSGLVFYTYSHTGLNVPRTSEEQFRASEKIALKQASEGDLVFFQDQAKLSHVGIYLGNGMFVHAPSSGRQVSIASLDAPYYQRHLVAVGRLLPN